MQQILAVFHEPSNQATPSGLPLSRSSLMAQVMAMSAAYGTAIPTLALPVLEQAEAPESSVSPDQRTFSGLQSRLRRDSRDKSKDDGSSASGTFGLGQNLSTITENLRLRMASTPLPRLQHCHARLELVNPGRLLILVSPSLSLFEFSSCICRICYG
ncbi:hypothetical protein J3459_011190 [Metarhizium acridum]|uniref:uncharacterized protein n=1 Tax=Metarhizium acridum TaxID=92637 RepID=UPI001C6BF562|nr:hypothetical protein J3458_009596 [Metarhizium acridum]KAG8418964.1 hypothetical protein J3459_011880 [Metarhizium acridum]KAG8420285.1 hypothetical protein J3459_011190 [Metarhizium acridum]